MEESLNKGLDHMGFKIQNLSSRGIFFTKGWTKIVNNMKQKRTFLSRPLFAKSFHDVSPGLFRK